MKPYKVYISSFSGLGKLNAREIQKVLTVKQNDINHFFSNRMEFNSFETSVPLENLNSLITPQSVFVHVHTFPITGSFDDLKSIILRGIHKLDLQHALSLFELTAFKKAQRGTYSIHIHADDVQWRAYRRVEIEDAFFKRLKRLQPTWRKVEKNSQFTFWIHQVGKQLLIGLEIFQNKLKEMSFETYLEDQLPLSVTGSMIFLSKPIPSDDIAFLNPGDGRSILQRINYRKFQHIFAYVHSLSEKEILTNNLPYLKSIEIGGVKKANTIDKIILPLVFSDSKMSQTDYENAINKSLQNAIPLLKKSGRMVILTNRSNFVKKIVLKNNVQVNEQIKTIRFPNFEGDLLVGVK